MNTQKNIAVAFILNLAFSVFEFFGGILSGSFAIMSDALHDFGDALGIGISLLLEKKSKKAPDEKFTFGYGRFSQIGALFTTVILIIGSVFIISNAIGRILNPVEIKHGKMIIFAIVGVLVNSLAAFFTREKSSANVRAVNLHMLEDVLGWICVLLGAVIIRFTGLFIIDPILSIAVSLFILYHAIHNLSDIFSVFLQKAPDSTGLSEIKEHLLKIDGISDIHHIHIWSHDDVNIHMTMHVVTDKNHAEIKKKVREELYHHGINHVTMELEAKDEICLCKECVVSHGHDGHHHHHHKH